MRWILVVVGLVIVLTGAALAQDTGGSIGGGDWGGGGGGGGGGDYSYSGGGSDDSYSGGGDYSSSGGGGGGGELSAGGALFILVAMVVILGVAMAWDQLKKDHLMSGAAYAATASSNAGAAYGEVDVTALRVGLDARVRPYVQRQLDLIARRADTKSPEGLVTTLHEVALMLRRLRDAWVYGGAENHAMSWKEVARSTFQQHATRARETFRTELVRNAAGVTTGADPATARAPRSDEGPGLVLVTLVVAARQELFTVRKIGTGDDLRRALEVLSALTALTLVAVEIVWTPADPDDRMSSVELETMLPGDVFPIQGAMVGKVVCSYCSGPFPAELMSCPHCGAPARDTQEAG